MKKRLLLSFIFPLSLHIYAQAPTIEWQKCFGGTKTESFSNIKKTSDGGYIVAGATSSNDGDLTINKGEYDAWIVKLNSNLVTEWQKTYGGSKQDYADCVQQTNDGGYIVTGYSESNDGDATFNHGTYTSGDYWIVKLNSLGVIEWQKSLGGSITERSYSISQTTDGGYIVVGNSISNDGDVSGLHSNGTTNAYDIWVVKLNIQGNITWQKALGGTQDEYAYSIKQTTDGGYILCGMSGSNDGDLIVNKGYSDGWIVKLNSLGNIDWQKTYGGSKTDTFKSISLTSDGGFIVIGSTVSTDGDVTSNDTSSNVWVVKINVSGVIEWQKVFGGTANDEGTDIFPTSDGGYVFTASSSSLDKDLTGNKGSSDAWIVKINQTGNLQWQKNIGGNSYDRIESIISNNDGSYIMAGYTFSNNEDVTNLKGSADGWIVKFASDHLSVDDFKNDYFITYPNPVSSVLNFESQNGEPIDKVTITDMNGKIILEQNQKTNQINTQQLTSGMYIINAFSSNKKHTQKIIKR
ncbi:T9SS type A sorting domain-containing protein [Flavobacterium sp. B11]|uniref:T9SS type A sorting domain-containing protein n=1 Tax=Flavobacterium movens TaxID=214860 RepID=UPI0031E37711